MPSVPGVDHPEEQSEAEVALTGRGISVSSRVESVGTGIVSVRPSAGAFVQQVVVRTGDPVEVIWQSGDETRALPAEVLQVEQGAVIRWQLGITGPAEVSQRRTAVRTRITLPVDVWLGNFEMKGETVDLSEAGLRVSCDGFGLPPEAGAARGLALHLEDGALEATAEVVRLQRRGTRWLLSLRFVDLPEKEGDRVRRRVFQALREERARLAD